MVDRDSARPWCMRISSPNTITATSRSNSSATSRISGRLAATQRLWAVVLAMAALVGKAAVLGTGIAVIDNSFAKLRLFKITEFASAAFLLAVLGVFTLYLGGG